MCSSWLFRRSPRRFPSRFVEIEFSSDVIHSYKKTSNNKKLANKYFNQFNLRPLPVYLEIDWSMISSDLGKESPWLIQGTTISFWTKSVFTWKLNFCNPWLRKKVSEFDRDRDSPGQKSQEIAKWKIENFALPAENVKFGKMIVAAVLDLCWIFTCET